MKNKDNEFDPIYIPLIIIGACTLATVITFAIMYFKNML